MEDFRDGKCLFCEYRVMLTALYFKCLNPDDNIAVRHTIPLAGEYPERFLPVALDGVCGIGC